jgi:hypothetical protein
MQEEHGDEANGGNNPRRSAKEESNDEASGGNRA